MKQLSKEEISRNFQARILGEKAIQTVKTTDDKRIVTDHTVSKLFDQGLDTLAVWMGVKERHKSSKVTAQKP
jgi:hypothetical protein